jgi:hypothetical protein
MHIYVSSLFVVSNPRLIHPYPTSLIKRELKEEFGMPAVMRKSSCGVVIRDMCRLRPLHCLQLEPKAKEDDYGGVAMYLCRQRLIASSDDHEDTP